MMKMISRKWSHGKKNMFLKYKTFDLIFDKQTNKRKQKKNNNNKINLS